MKKIFDFNDSTNPNFVIGRPREMAWPCKIFRITLPKSKRNSRHGLNVFELCILKLLAYDRYDPKSLAEETCLPTDLVKIILLRLFDMGKIDRHYQLNPETLEDLKKHDLEKEYEPTEYETWAIFQECIAGTLLPMLVDAKLKSAEMTDSEGIVVGTGKNKKEVRLWHLPVLQRDLEIPTVTDIISAIQTMIRRRKMSEGAYSIPKATYVSVASDPESCELRVRMVIQENGDWRIVNPFGKNWSLELESAYQKLLKENEKEKEAFQKWQSKYIGNGSQRNNNENNPRKASYETPDNWNRYSELIGTLRRGEKKGTDVYAAIEWALFYALKNCESTRNQIQILLIDSRDNNEKHIQDAIKNLTSIGGQNPISSPFPNRIRGFQNSEKAEMQTVLPLALLVAKDDRQFALNKVFRLYPDFLSRISKLKDVRDKYMHGNSKFSQSYGQDDYVFMKKVVTSLIPSIQFDDLPSEFRNDIEDIIDVRLNARIKLEGIFGVYLFDQMDNILQRELMDVEMFRNNNVNNPDNETDALQCINNLYSAVQCAFRPLLVSDHSARKDPISEAQQKANRAGWGILPQSLQTIRSDLLQLTLEGKDQTLGASIVAWLILTDITVLSKIADKLPDFLLDLGKLLELRSHGNKSIIISKEKLNNIIQNIYKIIRTIMEA